MTLRQRQSLFARLLSDLIKEAFARGYDVTMGECWRSPHEAARLSKTGKGIKKSLHCDRLAVDLNLFKDGTFRTKSEQYAEMGEYWESLHPDCRWGGRFSDGNHFAITYQGRS